MKTQSIGASALSAFPFATIEIRALLIDNQCWFVAKDVFAALDIYWNGSKGLDKIKAEWKGVVNLATPSETQSGRGGGAQDLLIIAEPAVYKIAFRSDKPEAERFTDCVAEIVTTIRKTGRYVAPQAPEPAPEPISANDHRNLQRVLWMIADRFHFHGSWTFAIWAALRQATGCAAPNPFTVRHQPLPLDAVGGAYDCGHYRSVGSAPPICASTSATRTGSSSSATAGAVGVPSITVWA